MKRKRLKYWVLRDKKNYFKQWTGIGPMATQKLDEASQFKTKREAMQSPAYSFAMTFYEPEAVR